MLKKFWHCRRTQDKGSNLKDLSEGHHQIPFCCKKFQYPEEKWWFWGLAGVKGYRLKLKRELDKNTREEHSLLNASALLQESGCSHGLALNGRRAWLPLSLANQQQAAASWVVTSCSAARCHPSAESWGACVELAGNTVSVAQLLSFTVL